MNYNLILEHVRYSRSLGEMSEHLNEQELAVAAVLLKAIEIGYEEGLADGANQG